MKKLFLFILCTCISLYTHEAILINSNNNTISSVVKRADFTESLSYLLNHEGYYVNHPDDRGKETYCGISRRFNPNWYGWRYVDSYKDTVQIKWNTRIPQLDHWVLDYYLNLWVKEYFYLIDNQDVANYLFDFRVNGTTGVRIIQKSLNDLGCNVKVNNTMSKQMIEKVNSLDPKDVLCAVKNRRTLFYKSIAKKDTSQKKFLKHWLKRSEL
jgi:lysozyme family protein